MATDDWHRLAHKPGPKLGSRQATEAVTEAAHQEAGLSGLPGYNDGPADALRHLIGTAELRRRFGWGFAFGATTYNELRGQLARQPFASDWMDMENNWIALRIGAQARTFADVVNLSQNAIADAIRTGGTDRRGVIWRAQRHWGDAPDRQFEDPANWRPPGPQLDGYRFGGAEHRLQFDSTTPRQAEAATLQRLAETPVADWSYDDVRAVMRSRPYSSGSDPSRVGWHAKVRDWFAGREAERAGRERASDDSCGGSAEVRAHTRQTANGQVAVAAHTRTVACRD